MFTAKNRSTLLASLLTVSSLCLVACSSEDLATGGGAGDNQDELNEKIALINLYTGLYSLPAGWNGIAGDTAFLSIGSASETDASAEARLIDYDDIDNCVPVNQSRGRIYQDSFTNKVFLDDILQFDAATLSAPGRTFTIEYTAVGNSRTSIEANRVDMMVEDLGVSCS